MLFLGNNRGKAPLGAVPAHEYTYKAVQPISKGNLAVVKVDETFALVEVVSVKPVIYLEPDRRYKWLVQKVDVNSHKHQVAMQEQVLNRQLAKFARSEREAS